VKTTVLASVTHVQVVVDHTVPIQLQRSTKLKTSHWLYWSVHLAYHIVFIFSQKSILSNHFATFFSRSQPFNEMFIFSSKSRCCSSTFTYALFALLSPVCHIWDVMLVWRKGNINKNCLCVTVLCTIIMVHKDTSSSYRSVDCIGLWSCLV